MISIQNKTFDDGEKIAVGKYINSTFDLPSEAHPQKMIIPNGSIFEQCTFNTDVYFTLEDARDKTVVQECHFNKDLKVTLRANYCLNKFLGRSDQLLTALTGLTCVLHTHTTLPKGIEKLQNISSLNLAFNKSLEHIPAEIGSLTKLQHLCMRGCEAIELLPDEICNLKMLKVLMLSKCKKLSTLPEQIDKLTELDELILTKCESLTHLPTALGNMTWLVGLDLNETPIKSIPEALTQFH